MARSIELARLFYKVEADAKGLDAQLKGAERSLGRTADFIKAHPVAAASALGAALLAVAAKAVQAAAKFEKAMAEVSTLVDTTTVDMGALSDGVLDLFKSLPIESMDDLTRGLYNVISAGIPAADAIDFLRVAAEASVGGVTDVNTAVDGLTTAVNAFASQGLTAKDAADTFFVAVKAGKTTFAEISSGIGKTASLANSLGIGLDDLLANMVALTKGGIGTNEAFSSLRQVLANVLKPTAAFTQQFPELAKQFDVAALKSKGLTQFMVDLAKELEGNDKAAVTMFGSVEALGSVLALTANDGAALRDVMAQMENRAGASGEAFGKMADTAENMHQVLKNQLAATMLELGNALLPTVNAGLRTLLSLLDQLSGKGPEKRVNFLATSLQNYDRVLRQAVEITKDATRATEDHDTAQEILRGTLVGMAKSLSDVATRGNGMLETFEKIARFTTRGTLTRRTNDELQALHFGFQSVIGSGQLFGKELEQVEAALLKVSTEMVRRNIPALQRTVAATNTVSDRFAVLAKAVASVGTASRDQQIALQKELETLRDGGELTTEQMALVENGLRAVARALDTVGGASDAAARKAAAHAAAQRQALRAAEQALGQVVTVSAEITQQVDLTSGLSPAWDRNAEAIRRYAVIAEENRQRNQQALTDEEERRKLLHQQADEVARVAHGLLGAGQAAGVLSSETAATLHNVINIAESISAMVISGSINLTSLVGILGSAAGIIASVFGESPETAARKRLLAENTDALADLARVNGDLVRISTPGRQIADVQSVLERLIAGGPTEGQPFLGVSFKDLVRELTAQGLGIGQFRQVLQELGLSDLLRGGVQPGGITLLSDLELVLQHLASFDTAALDTFAGQLQTLRDLLQIGLLPPAQEFAALLDLLAKQGATPIGEALRGINAFEPEGRADAIAALQELFLSLSRGEIDKSRFGGLNRSEFEDAIKHLIGLLQSDTDLAPLAGPLGFPQRPDQPDLDVLRVLESDVALAETAFAGATDFYAAELELGAAQLQTQQSIEALLAGIATFEPVAPPSLPDGFGTATGPGSVTVTIEAIHVHVAPGTDAEAQGRAAGRGFFDELTDRGLFDRLAYERLLRGIT